MPDPSTTVALLTAMARRLAAIETAYAQHTIATTGGSTVPPEPEPGKRGAACR